MKKLFSRCALIGIALSFASGVRAQFYLADPNASYLINGIGFEQLVTEGTTWNGIGNIQNSVIGFYSDTTSPGDYTATQPNPYSARGRVFWDGTNLSSSWAQEGGLQSPGEVGGVNLFALGDALGEDVSTTRRAPGTGDNLLNKDLDSEGPLHGTDPDWASNVGVGFTVVSGNRFSSVIVTTGYELQTVTFGGRGSGSINWHYSLDGTTLLNTGISTALTGTFSLKTLDLSALFSGNETVTLVGEFTGVSGGALVELDSFQFIGRAVTSAPSFATHPQNVTVNDGLDSSFTVLAGGNPIPTLQWQRSTDGGGTWGNLGNDATFSGVTTAILTVNDASPAINGHQFRARASNSVQADVASNAATLTVNAATSAPSFTTHPANQTITAGGNVNLTVAVAGNPPPTLQWQRSTNGGATWTNLSNDVTFGGVTTTTLAITAATLAMDTHQFRARASNSVQADVAGNAATLTVNVVPSFLAQPANQAVTGGGNASFTVGATGNPTPTLQWQRSTNGGTTWTDLSNDVTFGGVTTTTLAITAATLAMDTHQFRVRASNSVQADVASNAATLTVTAATSVPGFTTQPANQATTAGGNASFTVAIAGNPTPTLQWQRSINGGTTWTDLSNDGTFGGVTTTTLAITAATLALDTHQFRARASNSVQADVASNAAALTVTPPSPVINSPTTATGTVGVAFTYTIAATNTPTSFGATNLPSWASLNTTTGAITGTPDAAAVTAVSISATNAGGPGNGQVQITITVAPPVITSPTTATGTVGVSFTYTIAATNSPTSFGATNLPSWATLNATTGAITGTPDAAAVTAVNISATNAGGPGNGQVQITITVAPPVINSAATATGTVGSPFSYTITATNSPTSFGATNLPSWATLNTTTGAITGTPDAAAVTTVNISATNAGGPGNGQVQITIQPNVPAAPPPPTNSLTSYNAFTAQWTAVAGATGYRLDVATDAAFTQFVTGYQDLDVGNVTTKAVTGLPLGTYYFRVRAYNAGGTGSSSSASSVAVGSRLTNLSTRGQTSTASPMVGGFFVSGAPKTVLIRAAAKILADLGVAGTVPNPRLRLVNQATTLDIATNDDWNAADPVVIDAITRSGAGLVFTPGSVDSVIVAQNLAPGGYTAIVETVTGVAGIVLIELYEIDETGRLANISTRGVTVEAGSNVMIPGTFFGPTSKKLLIRVVGETLGNFLPPATVLTDPVLEIYDQDAPNTPLLTNDDWDVNDAALKATWTPGDPNQVAGLAFSPAGTKDAAVLVVLPKNNGGYTVIARGKNGATGNVLVEIYEAR